MKNILFCFLLSIFLICSFLSNSFSSDLYTTTQLTNNTYSDEHPQVNDKGHVVWMSTSKSYPWGEIFLYDGLTTTQLTNNIHHDDWPQINSKGDVVWVGNVGKVYPAKDGEIFLYDGSTTTNISNNDFTDGSPQINNSGHVVWSGSDGSDFEIFLYDGLTTTQLTDNNYNDFDPQINSKGNVVWVGKTGLGSMIFLYNGSKIIQLNCSSSNNWAPQINSNGHVVWEGYDGKDWEIFLYDGLTTPQITDNNKNDKHPQINNMGHLVWHRGSYYSWDIYLYDGSITTQITDNKYQNSSPQINDNGYVVWATDNPNQSYISIYVYNGDSTVEVAQSYGQLDATCSQHRININGQVVWNGETALEMDHDRWDNEIFLTTVGTNESETVTLLAPDCGEIIPSGSSYSIEWNPSFEIENFKLQYSINNGKDWVTIAKDIAGTNYDWIVPTFKKNKKNCLMKVVGYDASGEKVDVDKSDDPFSIEVMNVTSPNGGEVLASGGAYYVDWDTNDTNSAVDYVKIYSSINKGKTWKLLATEEGNPGISSCVFPVVRKNEDDCLVKAMAFDAEDKKVAEDKSDALFGIEVVTITSPNGSETLTSGTTHSITWDTYETKKDIATVILKYTINGGKTWEKIKTIKGENPGTYLWTVSEVPKAKNKSKVKVFLKDKKGKNLGTDASDNYFRIEP